MDNTDLLIHWSGFVRDFPPAIDIKDAESFLSIIMIEELLAKYTHHKFKREHVNNFLLENGYSQSEVGDDLFWLIKK